MLEMKDNLVEYEREKAYMSLSKSAIEKRTSQIDTYDPQAKLTSLKYSNSGKISIIAPF